MKSAAISWRNWMMLIGVSLSSFVAFIDFTIVSAALPTIQRDLAPTFIQLEWFMNIFVLVHCILLVVMGDLGDLFGRRLMNYIGMVLFAIASLFAGLAHSSTAFIFWRGLQGGACAITIPCSLALISATFPQKQRGRAIGIWTSITGIGLAIGPVLGGIFSELWSWRWIFYINVPVIILSILICWRSVDESRNHNRSGQIDWLGFLCLAFGIGSLVTAFVQGPIWGWSSWQILSLFVLAVVGLYAFIQVEKRAKEPIIQFKLFANRMFFSSAVAAFTILFFMWSCFFLMPLYLQNIRGETPEIVGFMLLPITAIVVIFSPVIGKIVDKIGVKPPIVIGLSLLVISAGLQIFFRAHSPIEQVMLAFIIFGMAWGAIFGPMAVGAISSLPHRFAGVASGTLWTIQNIGGAIGLAIAGVVFHYKDRSYLMQHKAQLSSSDYRLVEEILNDPEKSVQIAQMAAHDQTNALVELLKNAFMHGYSGVMMLLSVLAVVALVIISVYMKKNRG